MIACSRTTLVFRGFIIATLLLCGCGGPLGGGAAAGTQDVTQIDGSIADTGVDSAAGPTDSVTADGLAADLAPADIDTQPHLRDWQKYPAVVVRTQPKLLLAIGDIHGDLDRAQQVLKAAAAVDGDGHWIAVAGTTVVCTGDMIDKGDKSLMVVQWMRTLQAQAVAAGGEVIVLLGNHEAEFLAAPDDVKVGEFAAELQVNGFPPAQVAQGLDAQGIGTWLRRLPVAARLGGWFFSHAGNTHGRTLAQLQADLQNDLDLKGFASLQLLADDSILQTKLDVPWWQDDKQNSADILKNWAQSLGAERFVQGHQPGSVDLSDGPSGGTAKRKKYQLFQNYGRIFLIDCGMSQGVRSSDTAKDQAKPYGLMQLGNATATAVFSDGSKSILWP